MLARNIKKTFIVILVILSGCNKNSDPIPPITPSEPKDTLLYGDLKVDILDQSGAYYLFDTIMPNNYYPVFPGSWWRYLDQDGDTIVINVSDTYLKDSVSGTTFKYVSWVPFVGDYGIWGNLKNCCIYTNGQAYLSRMFFDTDTVNVTWVSGSFSPGPNYPIYSKQLEYNTSITIEAAVYDSVIIVRSYTEYISDNWHKYYYCKNIGIIKEEDLYPDGQYHEMNIIDYFINH
jgi:hypothetical protein